MIPQLAIELRGRDFSCAPFRASNNGNDTWWALAPSRSVRRVPLTQSDNYAEQATDNSVYDMV